MLSQRLCKPATLTVSSALAFAFLRFLQREHEARPSGLEGLPARSPAAQAAQGLQPGASGPRRAWRTYLDASSRGSGTGGSASARRTANRRAAACRLVSIPRRRRSRRGADQAEQSIAAGTSPGGTSGAASAIRGLARPSSAAASRLKGFAGGHRNLRQKGPRLYAERRFAAASGARGASHPRTGECNVILVPDASALPYVVKSTGPRPGP